MGVASVLFPQLSLFLPVRLPSQTSTSALLQRCLGRRPQKLDPARPNTTSLGRIGDTPTEIQQVTCVAVVGSPTFFV